MKTVAFNAALAVLVVLVPLASAIAPPARAQASAPAGVIRDVQGPVSWHAAGTARFQDAHGGESLFPGAVVRTGVRGFAHIQWRNGGDFKLYPLSELAVPEDEGVHLNAGSIWAKFSHKLLKPFYFQSPTATAVVRGTTLGVEVVPQGGTRVAVIEGHVEVTGLHMPGSIMLAPGQAVTISPVGMLGPVEPVSPRERDLNRQSFNPNGGPGGWPNRPERAGGPPGQPGPGGPAGPGRQPEHMQGPRVGLDWFRQFRAVDRLDQVRAQMQGPPGMPRGPQRPMPGGMPAPYGHPANQPERPGYPFLGAPEAADPGQNLPDGRPPDQDQRGGLHEPHLPVCLPAPGAVTLPGPGAVGPSICPPPPVPLQGQAAPPPAGTTKAPTP